MLVALSGAQLYGQTVMDTKPELIPSEPHPAGWWPNDGLAPRQTYVGPEACASCHPAETASWKTSQMAHAIKPAAESKFLRAHPHLSYKRGPYTYRIDTAGGHALYTVTDGQHELSIPLLWAYGTGVVGQAYVFRINGVYYEAVVAYYPVLDGLDVVAGLIRTMPPDLPRAFGLPLSSDAAQQCISCHTTAAVTGKQLRVNSMILGVTCEACHGPGARHVAVMEARGKQSAPNATFIFSPAKLHPPDLENFCGACHRTSLRVIREGLHGLDTVHYEPYRLEMSQCWIMSQRITCTTCHNPHQPLERHTAAYDSACLSCHLSKAGPVTASHPAKACPVAARDCASCHMPKCRLPLAPFKMSDHFIRVVGPNDACAKS
ncbi:MAG TPA: multiheme c-type cytochrome [Terriglobia bacterium]|nr:multiheme c-type cytochrome [Terriglobia bacterium]